MQNAERVGRDGKQVQVYQVRFVGVYLNDCRTGIGWHVLVCQKIWFLGKARVEEIEDWGILAWDQDLSPLDDSS